MIALPLSTTATGDLNRIEAKIFPNPATEYVMLELPGKEIHAVRVFTMEGKQLPTAIVLETDRVKVNTANFPAGQYMVEVSGDDFVSTSKVSVQR